MRRLTVNYPPARGNISESSPQAVMLLVVNQNDEASAVIIKRVGLHQITYNTESKRLHGCDQTVMFGLPYRLCRAQRKSSCPDVRSRRLHGPKVVAVPTVCWSAPSMSASRPLAPMQWEMAVVPRRHSNEDTATPPFDVSLDRRAIFCRCP
jgi:hypothetical protein